MHHYIFVEVQAPDGYKIMNEVTEVPYGGDQNVEVLNEPTTVKVEKVWSDNKNAAQLRPSEIKLTLTSPKGSVSKTYPVDKLLDKETFVFEGMDTVNDDGSPVQFTLSEENVPYYVSKVEGLTVTNTLLEVPFSKVDTKTKQELPGATLNLKGIDLDETWTSTDTPHILPLKQGTYTLTETQAPKGYKLAETITFEVTADGKIMMNGQALTDNKIVMKDIPNTVEVTKIWQDHTNSNQLRPSVITLTLTSVNGSVDKTFPVDPGKEQEVFIFDGIDTTLPDGSPIDYTLSEKTIPYYSSKVDGMSVTNTLVELTISKIDASTKKELAGASLQIKGGDIDVTWTTGNSPKILPVKPGTYTLTEVSAPQGYQIAQPVSFEVTPDGKVQKNGVELLNNLLVMEDSPVVPPVISSTATTSVVKPTTTATSTITSGTTTKPTSSTTSKVTTLTTTTPSTTPETTTTTATTMATTTTKVTTTPKPTTTPLVTTTVLPTPAPVVTSALPPTTTTTPTTTQVTTPTTTTTEAATTQTSLPSTTPEDTTPVLTSTEKAAKTGEQANLPILGSFLTLLGSLVFVWIRKKTSSDFREE